MLFNKLKFAIPLWFVWTVLILVLLPDLLYLAGVDFGTLDWNWKSFAYSGLESASVVTAFLIVIISFIDFRIKGDVSTPLVASTMLFSGTLDLVHIMASQGLILNPEQLTFNSIYTWSFSRTFNALMLLIGAGLFLIQSDNLFRNVKLHNRKFLIYIIVLFAIATIAFINLVAGLDDKSRTMLFPYVYSRQLDLIPLMLYLFSLTIIFPKFSSNHPSIFSQTLLLSLVPAVSAQLHVVFGNAVPYDHNTMVASYEKLISFLVPFAGVAMNYLQTHFNEVRAISRYRTESNQKQQLNSLLEGIMDVSLSGILVFESLYDAKGTIRDFRCIKFNSGASRLINVQLTQGQLFRDIFRDDSEMFKEYIKLVEAGNSFDRVLFCERIQKWLSVSSVKYRNGFMMTIVDITDSRMADEQMRKREALLSQAEAVAQLGSWEVDIKTEKVSLSDNMIRMLGLEPTNIIDQRSAMAERVHPDDKEKSIKALRLAIENKSDYFNEFRLPLPDGSMRYLVSTGKILYDDKGEQPLKCIGVTMDVSSRVLAAGQVRRNEILYQTFASNMPDTEVILFNDRFEIILTEGNSAVPLLRTRKDLIGQDIRLVPDLIDLHIEVDNMLSPAFQEKSVSTEIIDSRYFRVHKVRIDGEEGTAVFGMLLFQDVTEMKKAELQLETRLLELDRSNRELENFAYVASHDLQEPLRKISAFGDRLKSKYKEQLPQEGQDYVRRMTEATSRMQRLISDLLSFSRISRMAEPFQVVNLEKIIHDILGDIEMKINTSGAKVEYTGLGELEGVSSQLHQLFQNLILNAIKFSKPGISPVVTIQGEFLSSRALNKKGNRRYLRISVKDNGIGFDQKYSDRIFTLFQRLHGRHEYEGTGIGLALCKKIAEHHHGTIEAFGNENEGAEFVVILPVQQTRKEARPEIVSVNFKREKTNT